MRVSETRYRYAHITGKGTQVKLLWIPPHIGLCKHNEVDTLANLALDKKAAENNNGLSRKFLINVTKKEREDEYKASRKVQINPLSVIIICIK